MGTPISIALVQVGTDPADPPGNRSLLASLAKEAFADGADVVVLPEMASSGYTTDKAELARASESLEGPTTSSWTELASAHGGYIASGLCEKHDGELFNTAVLVGPDGIVLHYRKLHLFGEEKNVFTKGDLGLPIAITELGTIGLCICYDLRFVEVARALALQGVDLLCVPTAWIAGFDTLPAEGDMCWQAKGVVLQANLDQMFIACASQVGSPGAYEFLGSSVAAGPLGEVVIGPLSATEPEIAIAEIDPGAVAEAQRRGPLITPREDRRTDVYGITIDGNVL